MSEVHWDIDKKGFYFKWKVKNFQSKCTTEIVMKLIECGIMADSMLFRVNFSTFFVNSKIIFNFNNVDKPDLSMPKDFEITLYFESRHKDQFVKGKVEIFKELYLKK